MGIPFSEFYEMFDFFKENAEYMTLLEAVEKWNCIRISGDDSRNADLPLGGVE